MKKTVGENWFETKLGEKTKRALMMLPLLPVDLITVEVVDLIIGRWKSAFQQRPDFDELRDYIVRTYVRPNASFKKEFWSVCGQSIRTNNAAENSHAVLNTYVRVRGEMSLDSFLFAIEQQMRNTKREIQAGCPSHTKGIYARRNELLAVELSELLNGNQDVIAFLDNCSTAMTIKNNAGIQTFRTQRTSQLMTPAQQEWIRRHWTNVLRAALSVHRKIAPMSQTRLDVVLATVQQWAFQRDPCNVNTDAIQEDSVLSRVGPETCPSFVEIVESLRGDDGPTSEEADSTAMRSEAMAPTEPTTVFHGESYQLVIRR